jgi:hypothetical protein
LSELRLADLNAAILNGADLGGANLSWADLSWADLGGANLNAANLSWANLSAADLNEATVGSTLFADIDLSTANGLNTVRHSGPSSISTDSLVRSNGKIPEVFLRGCGMPDSFIENLQSLLGTMQPIQFYSCFISYSHKNEDFAKCLHQRMQAEKLRVWYAPEDMKAGQKLHEQIDEAIRVFDMLVLVLSEESIQSEWVMTEIRKARKAELRDKRRKLFPIRLVGYKALQDWECPDTHTGGDLAEEVRQYFIPDFTRWKDHDAFEDEFDRLLRDLRVVDAPPAPPTSSAVEDGSS